MPKLQTSYTVSETLLAHGSERVGVYAPSTLRADCTNKARRLAMVQPLSLSTPMQENLDMYFKGIEYIFALSAAL